eukprot:gene12289-5872_t
MNTVYFITLFLIGCVTSQNFVLVSDVHIDLKKYPNSIPNAKQIVNHINSITEKEKIEFVIITGDCTDRATMLPEFKSIFSKLKVPYLPMTGNHDILKNNATWGETKPTGDLEFGKMFKENFKSFPNLHWNEAPTWNPEISSFSHFQNFYVNLNGLVLIGLDFNSRISGRGVGFNGVIPKGEFHDFPGGTFHWLENSLKKLKNEKVSQIVFVQHHPFRIPLSRIPLLFGFVKSQKEKLMKLYERYFPKEIYWGVFAGHIHRYYNGLSFDGWNMKQWETNANGKKTAFTLVKVENSKIISVRHNYL